MKEINRTEVIAQKIERLASGHLPRVIDLFAGCGGLSLGFLSAGFEISAAVEIEVDAIRSHSRNFHSGSPIHARPRDITLQDPSDLVGELRLDSAPYAFDVVVGGPPCQAFARVGRAKLREVAEHPEAFRLDPRSSLYLRYLAYIQEFRPLAVLMENVPDVMNFGGHNIPEEICEYLSELGYECGYTLLNSVFYGVPQMRERVFLLAYAKELGCAVKFPKATHWTSLPRGYKGSRDVAMQGIGFFTNYFVHFNHSNGEGKRSAITTEEAIGDLPPITLHLEGKLKRGARRFHELIPYEKNCKLSEYAKVMREWPGFENHEGIRDHVIRYLPRDYPLFRRMNPGDQYPEAFQHAHEMFSEKLEELRLGGQVIEDGSIDFINLYKSIVPPYDPDKFPNKWRKMERESPARTLMAHLGKLECHKCVKGSSC